ncbi:MAG TPA: ABC transporter substrate-binding protein [Methanolinea sp.]|nr:ABC transporter substrate-binding protein [Methanolinea sp.]HQK56411.1 ABC transporter substrate-binding protein [Methanolinea sp.]
MNTPLIAVLAVCMLLCPFVVADAALPGDLDGNGFIAKEELASSILAILSSGTTPPDATLSDLRDAAWMYVHWNGTARTVTDSSGKSLTLTRPLRRIIVMNSETLETMRSLGVKKERIVAVDKFIAQKPEFFPEYAGYPSVGSIWAPDYEKMLSMRPDALFLYASVSRAECDEIERRVTASRPSLPVFRIDCYRPETYLEDAARIAEIFGEEEKGARLAAFYTDALTKVAAAASSSAPPEVYFETWNDYKTVARGSGYHDKVTMAGGANIFRDNPAEYPEIDPESVIARKPDVVIKLAGSGKYIFGGYSGENSSRFGEVRNTLLGRAGWSSIPAVRDGRVYVIHNAVLGGPQYLIGVTYMARWFHPDGAGDLDPESLHRMYLQEFQGLDPGLAHPDRFVFPAR